MTERKPGQVIGRMTCPACGKLAPITLTKNAKACMICPHEDERAGRMCYTRVFFGLAHTERLLRAAEGGAAPGRAADTDKGGDDGGFYI